MTRLRVYLLTVKARYQTRRIMQRYRVWTIDRVTGTESELRAMWGDR